MAYTVRDWMIDLVVYISPDATVTEALSLMRRRYLHSLIVSTTTDSPQLGIITSTDVCDKILAQGRNPTKTKVREIMTAPLIMVPWNLTIQECAALMSKNRFHHLPVMNDQGELVGMISATDFLVVAEAMGRSAGERI
jgi:CBS domain-containing protein